MRPTRLKFPGEPAASLELVHRPGGGPVDVGSGFDHLAIQVATLAATVERLTDAGLDPGPLQYPGGPRGPKASWLTDSDGYRIEWWSGRSDTPRASPPGLLLSPVSSALPEHVPASPHTSCQVMISLRPSPPSTLPPGW
ncbi:hypothetical protein QFZ68_006577 [Streptomyces sp. V1I6]|nr:hypothetical protein [Streptomyces sp. V1I6]